MRNTLPPDRPPLHDYDLGVAATAEGAVQDSLRARRADVVDLHEHYAAIGGRPHLMTSTDAWSDADKLAQRSLYPLTNKGRPLSDLRAAVFKAAGSRCLLCNADRPTSLDHVLPKTTHPTLSVLPLNLIGACETCNRRKSTTSLADPEKQFVHPYFDVLPQDRVWLGCSPLSADGLLAPSFAIQVAPGMDLELARRLEWQFAELKLGEYYSDEAVQHCRGQADGWLEVLEGSADDFRIGLERDLRSNNRAFGPNTWKSALLSGMLADAAFMQTARDVLEAVLAD